MHVNAKEHSSTLGWWHRPLVTWRFETALHWWSISQPHFGRILHRWGGRNPNWRAKALGFRAGYFRIQDPEKQHQTNPGVERALSNYWKLRDGLSSKFLENCAKHFINFFPLLVNDLPFLSFRIEKNLMTIAILAGIDIHQPSKGLQIKRMPWIAIDDCL